MAGVRWTGPWRNELNGGSTSRAEALDRLCRDVVYKLYENDLLDLNVYAMEQWILVSYGNNPAPEPRPRERVKWRDGYLCPEDLLAFAKRKKLPCAEEFIHG